MGTNSHSYRYDPIGNRQTATNNAEAWSYAANALNQYTQITNNQSPITPTYDADGNMLTYNGWTFGWNGENRMIAASNGTTVVTFAYDFMGRRYQKVTGATTNTFLYDGWNLISETQVSGVSTQVSSYVWGLDLAGTLQGAGGIGGLLSVTRNGVHSFPCYDANGNITDYVDINGVVVAHREYDAYGNTLVSSGSMVDNFNCCFSSKYLDKETSLLYYGQRYYSAKLSRWISRDPIGERGGPNLIEFVLNNPLNKTDFIGLDNAPSSGVYFLGYWNTFGPLPGSCGSFLWVINWLLSYGADYGGWVVQHTEVDTTATDCNGNPVICEPTRAHFWEALGTIPKDYSMSSGAYDAWGHRGCGVCTKGTITVYGSANFYDGMPTTVPPPGFGNCGAPCGAAPCTWMSPALSANRVVGPARRSLTATWNCCPNASLTSITVSP